MYDIVYSVNGGLEDWSYAAGWENNIEGYSSVIDCNPSNSNYPDYLTSTFRTNIRNMMYLIEAGVK